MANLKLVLVAAALVATCRSVKPPGFVERPSVRDKSPPNYAFDYEVRDHDGGSQGHTEVRKGIFAVGGYYSRLPGESGSQRVAYYADDWGFHPVLVAYGGRGYSTRLAFGDKAVATANAAATGDFNGGSSIQSIGVNVPETVNPLPDLTQTGAAALAAENPQKTDADQLLATVGQPPAPPQPPKPFQAVGVVPAGNPKVSSSALHSVAASSLAYRPQKIGSYNLPTATAQVIPVHTSGFLPVQPAATHVTPTGSAPLTPIVVTHGAPENANSFVSSSISSHLAPLTFTNFAPSASAAVSVAPVKSSNALHPAAQQHVSPGLAAHGASATSYGAPAIGVHTAPAASAQFAPAVSTHVVPALATGHVAPAGTTFISPAAPIYTAQANVEIEGSSYTASPVNKYSSPSIAISKPTPQPFIFSSTPIPATIIEENEQEIKSENGVVQGVSAPAFSYISSTPATFQKANEVIASSTVAPSLFNHDRYNIKETAAAAAASAASALSAAAETESESSFNLNDSGIQSEQESFYSQSSQNEGESSSFSSSSGVNEALQGIGEQSQQEYSQDGGYQYERPANGLTYTPQTGSSQFEIQSGGAIGQTYQYRPPFTQENYQNAAFFYNTGYRPQYQARPQLDFSGGTSSLSSSSHSSSSLSTSSINSGAFHDTSFGSEEQISYKPQVSDVIQSLPHHNRPYPSFPNFEVSGNGYQGIGLANVDLEEQRRVVAAQGSNLGVDQEYNIPKLTRPIVVAELPKGDTVPQTIQETSTFAPPTPNPTFSQEFSYSTTTSSYPSTVDVTTPSPISLTESEPPFYSSLPPKTGCRFCQGTGFQSSTSPSGSPAEEVSTTFAYTSTEPIQPSDPTPTGTPGCKYCKPQSTETSTQTPYEVTTTSPLEVTTESPTTSPEPVTAFYSTFPANSICRSCQYSSSQAINLLTAPATDSTSTTLDDELQQVFFPTSTASLESENNDFETTKTINVTPKPFSLEESVSSNPTKPTVSVQVVDEENNRATTTSSSSFEDYSDSVGSKGEGFTLEKDRQSFSTASISNGQFVSDTGATGSQSFNGQNEGTFTSGGGNQFYTGTSGGGNQFYTDTSGGDDGQYYSENHSGGGEYYSGLEEASRVSQGFSGGSGGQQAYQRLSGSSGSGGYYKGADVYTKSTTAAPPLRAQGSSFNNANQSPPSVLYVDRPVAVPMPYAVPQFVPYTAKGSSNRGRNGYRTASTSSSSSAGSLESSTPSVISVTQITKIRTSGRKTSDRQYVKQIVEETSAGPTEDEEDGEEVVIKGGSVKVRPDSFKQQHAYFRPVPRPVPFRASSEAGVSAGRLQYGDRIRVERPRKLCIEYGGFKAPLVPSAQDYSQSINLRLPPKDAELRYTVQDCVRLSRIRLATHHYGHKSAVCLRAMESVVHQWRCQAEAKASKHPTPAQQQLTM
ncbi:uncharacterized protein [Hetaerina americana]|uniref:uncharacterized protein n=1 Tax=Hetaerina americana TaxID=62018 RepID=UPI003A7F12AB